jgi:P27 family predicted phage terminase small subunit
MHLSGPARYEWRRIVPELEALGLLTQIDRAALAGYCQAYGRWVIAEKKLTELSSISPDKMAFLYKCANGNLIINPLLSVASKAMEQMHKFLVEFGMTPSARSRLSVVSGEAEDPMDNILNTKARRN